jgi:hypothetical protein
MSRIATYLSFVRFSHSVFALPFALTGALLAWRDSSTSFRAGPRGTRSYGFFSAW